MSQPVTGQSTEPWREPAWIAQTQLLLNSFRHWLRRDLIERSKDAEDESRRLFEVPFVVVSHNTQPDPILNYANRQALQLWEMDLPTLLATPSRLTAEPVERAERAQ